MAIIKFGEKTIPEYSINVSSIEEKPDGGSVIAIVAGLASSLGLLSANISAEENVTEEIAKCQNDFEILRKYFVHLADEYIKSVAPVRKYEKTDLSDMLNAGHYQSSLRLADSIPLEYLYKSIEAIEELTVLLENGSVKTTITIGIALNLYKSVIESCRLLVLENANHITDDVYQMTMRKENAIIMNMANERLDKAFKIVEERLNG